MLREPDALVDRWASAVIGAAIEVHRTLGPGLLEAIYEEALCIEMEERGIRFERQAPTIRYYKGRVAGEGRLDLLIEGCLPVALKAVSPLPPHAFAQVLSYLRATRLQLGLIINFNALPLKNNGIHRAVLS
jgi:GxxExxY protein